MKSAKHLDERSNPPLQRTDASGALLPGAPHFVGTVDPPEKFAPWGFVQATAADISAAGLQTLIKGEGPADTWDFGDMLGFSRRES